MNNSDAELAVRVDGLGLQYRSRIRGNNWALRGCGFGVPAGRVAALVGSNGAGKTTLMSILAGLLTPTEGSATVGDGTPASQRVSFVAQEKPLYKHFSVRDMLKVGAKLNTVWDQQRALRWLSRFDIPLDRPCGKLSGGQQAHVAFAVAVGARPSVLLLDEPLANLDPLARRDVTQELLGEVADTGTTVLLSTHVISELGGVADYLVLLAHGHLIADGDVDDLLACHQFYVGPRSQKPPVPGRVIKDSHSANQSTFLIRGVLGQPMPPVAEPWTVRPVPLEDMVIAYLEADRASKALAA